MSRSRRKLPITGMTGARSEKADKRTAAQRARAQSRQALLCAPGDVLAPDRKAAGSPWSFAKDGKHWWNPRDMARRYGTRYVRKLMGK